MTNPRHINRNYTKFAQRFPHAEPICPALAYDGAVQYVADRFSHDADGTRRAALAAREAVNDEDYLPAAAMEWRHQLREADHAHDRLVGAVCGAYASGMRLTDIAEKIGVTVMTVRRAVGLTK